MNDQEPLLNFAEFEQSLEEAERSLELLKQRYIQVKQDLQTKQELQQRKIQLKQEKNPKTHPLKTELKYIQQEIDQIELNLESRLFQWSQLTEPFWLIVRFVGLGIVIGLILAGF
jgi:multidrug efflux pump subunit AcrA (membrane-fusion protein)